MTSTGEPRGGRPQAAAASRSGAPAQLWRCRSGASAVEFCLVYPLLILLLAGSWEVSKAVNASRRLTTFASSAATMIASDANGSIAYTDLHYAADSVMVTFPDVLADAHSKGQAWSKDITVSMAGIAFTPTVPGCKFFCTYKASVVWTAGSAGRKCGSTISSASDTAAPSPTTLPSDLFTPVASPSGGFNPPPFAVVVDVNYTWRPMIFSRFFGNLSISRSAYVTSRYASSITYAKASGDDGFGSECAGY